MRPLLRLLAFVLGLVSLHAAEPFEIKDGDRVLFLGDTLLEREGTYGYLETRMHEQFSERHFIVRNLAFAADTPLGWSRASFDPAAKGFERLKEQIDLVKPTIVFLGYGMAASLQEMTDRSGDPTLNPDPVRYGAEPMSAARFKRELGQLMDAINEANKAQGGTGVRYVLLSPIRHEDLRKFKPGLPDPTDHNKMLEQYTKAIEGLADERGATFINLFKPHVEDTVRTPAGKVAKGPQKREEALTDNGIHLNQLGYAWLGLTIEELLFPHIVDPAQDDAAQKAAMATWFASFEPIRAAVIHKNELFFHRWRPANSTYLFGFRKYEQGQNAKEIPEFDPLIAAADAEIDRLKTAVAQGKPTAAAIPAVKDAEPVPPLPKPEFTLDDGLQIELWAENPLLFKPTEMNWDPQGRLWVASSALYPQIAPGGEATDKIIILEDPDRTGKATKSTVFAEGLLLPTGVAPTPLPTKAGQPQRYGCFVGQSTELLYFEDTKGSGKADQRHVVLSGFGTEDTHHILHTLKWGPDGRLYMDQSIYIHTHTETPWGVVRLNSGGCLSWDPRTEKVEVLAKGFINPWGHQFDQWGQNFFTDGAGSGGINWAFPGAEFVTYEGARHSPMPSVSPGAYPKFAGLELIASPHFPSDWQGNAITCDFRAHRIVRFGVTDLAKGTPAQAGYVTQEMPDVVRTSDVAFRPIDVKLGPDGALYVADWSNPVINHGEVDFRDPRRDHTHGRIWRITKKEGPLVQWEDLTKKSADALFSLFAQPGGPQNIWLREQSLRVLAMKPTSQIESASREFLRGSPSAERYAELNFLRSAYYGLHLDAFKPLAEPITAAQVRDSVAGLSGDGVAQTLQLLLSQAAMAETVFRDQPAKRDAFRAQLFAMLEAYVEHPHPRVRLGAVRVLGAIPTAESATLVLNTAAKNNGDPFLDYATWLSINDLAKPWTEAIASGAWKTEGREKQLEYGLNAIDPAMAGAALAKILSDEKLDFTKGPWIDLVSRGGGPHELAKLFEALILFYGPDCCPDRDTASVKIPNLSEADAQRVIAALLAAARDRGVRPDGELLLAKFVEAAPEKLRPGLLQLAGFWKTTDAPTFLPALARDKSAHPPLRIAAIEGLRALGGDGAIATLTSLCAPEQPFAIRRAALGALAGLKLPAALALAQPVLHDANTEAEALPGWRQLLSVQGGIDALQAKFDDAAWAKELPPPALAAALKAAREKGHAGANLTKSIEAAGGKVAVSPRDLAVEIANMVKAVQIGADPGQGELIYRRIGCVQCHSIGGAGGKLGPDLSSLGASAPLDYIVESVFDPAAKVKEGYHAFAYTMKDGSQFTGIPTRETATEQFIRPGPVPEIPLAKANIVKRDLVGSLMPPGLADGLDYTEKRCLFAFLSQIGRPGPFDASKGSVARLWRLYPGAQAAEAQHAEKIDEAPPAYTLIDGRLPREQFATALQALPNAGDTVVAAAQFQLAAAGQTRLHLTGVSKAWLDGAPLAVASEPNPTADLAAGVHTLAVQFDTKALPEILRADAEGANFLGN